MRKKKLGSLSGEKSQDWIMPGIFMQGLGLHFRASRALVVSDLHLGFEEALNKQGIFVPRFNFAETKKALEQMFSALPKLKFVVVNGDLKHEFGVISQQEWNEVLGVIDLIQAHCSEIVLVRGNHDKVLGPLAEKKGLRIKESGFWLAKERAFITHGDKVRRSKQYEMAKIIVIGNEHPALTLREGVKSEKYKCFLKGKFKGKILLVLPSLNFVSVGTDVMREKLLSPFLHQDLSGFEAWAVEDKPYYFGRLGKLMKRLVK